MALLCYKQYKLRDSNKYTQGPNKATYSRYARYPPEGPQQRRAQTGRDGWDRLIYPNSAMSFLVQEPLLIFNLESRKKREDDGDGGVVQF